MEDIAGIDVGARIRRERAMLGKGWAEGPQSPIPDRLFALGRFGQKTGAGWYRYEPDSRTPYPDPLIDDLACAAAAVRGVPRRPIDDEEIVIRLLCALVNEGLKLVEEGLAVRAGDVDVIYCYGFGFPRHRGGPLFWADTVGLPALLDRIRHYRDRLGAHWAPAPLLERLAGEGRRLYDE
jgi:3-hydroxyacyl-CoA dehydrogenase